MALESRVSVIFPLLGSVFSRHLVSLLRVPSGFGSPLSPVLPRCSVTCCLSGRTSFPSFGSYHRSHACCSCSPALSRPPLAARAFRVQAWALFFLRSALLPLLSVGDRQAYQVSGKTPYSHALLTRPRRTSVPRL